MTELPGGCAKTGSCCVGNEVQLSVFDIKRMARGLGAKPAELFQKKILTYRITSNGFMQPVINNRQHDLRVCPFLVSSGGAERPCGIYENRPFACRLYPFKYDLLYDEMQLPAENLQRCPGCTEKRTPGEVENELHDELKEFKEYKHMISKHILNGMNIFAIKNDRPAQKKFFQLLRATFENIEA